MPTKTESEYMAFRPGDLAEKIEGMAKRNGYSKSELIRLAIEKFLGCEQILPHALYLGAAWEFSMLAKAARDFGIVSHDSLVGLVHALEKTEREVREKLEPFVGRKPGMEWRDDGLLSRFFDLEEACQAIKRLTPSSGSPTVGALIASEAKHCGNRPVWKDTKPFPTRERKRVDSENKTRTRGRGRK